MAQTEQAGGAEIEKGVLPERVLREDVRFLLMQNEVARTETDARAKLVRHVATGTELGKLHARAHQGYWGVEWVDHGSKANYELVNGIAMEYLKYEAEFEKAHKCGDLTEYILSLRVNGTVNETGEGFWSKWTNERYGESGKLNPDNPIIKDELEEITAVIQAQIESQQTLSDIKTPDRF